MLKECNVSFGSFIIGSGLNDGEWHDVRFLAKENFAMLTIDGDEASAVRTNSPVQITTGSTYHFGGAFLNQLAFINTAINITLLLTQQKTTRTDFLGIPGVLDSQRPLNSVLLRVTGSA